MGKLLLIAVAAVALAADKPAAAPAPKPLTQAQIATIQDLTQRASHLAKEQSDFERTIVAERRVIQLEFEQLTSKVCYPMTSDECYLDVTGQDPAQWAAKPKPPAPPKDTKK